MKAILDTKTGITCLQANDKNYYVGFLSDAGVRIYEENPLPSFAIDKVTYAIDGVSASDNGGKAEVSYGNLTLIFSMDMGFSIVKGGETVYVFEPFKPEAKEEDLSLKEKEGHKVERHDSFINGFAIDANLPVYGLGDKTGTLDKRGYAYINWCSDIPDPHEDSFPSLYKAINFFTLFNKEKTLGVYLDNSSKTAFDFNKTDRNKVLVSYSAGSFDLYLFLGNLPDVIAEYTLLTGRTPLPPRWALGNQQSRWSYPDKKTVEEVIEGYRKADIPLSAIYLDIDYMVGYKDFSIDEQKFPNIDAWLASLKEKDIHIVPIIDAGVKAEEGYDVYDEGIRDDHFSKLDGQVYHNEVWPGDSVFPSFLDEHTQNWWADHVAKFLTHGFGGIWNDMNEPASFKGPLPLDVEMGGYPHYLAHNVYGHSMAKATYKGFLRVKRRPFIVTRAAYAGSARYSTTWTGDNQSLWSHLRMTIPQFCNLSLSGMGFLGCDIGGFNFDCTDELMRKWIVASLFSPLMRNHSACGCKRQEAYQFDEETQKIYRATVMLRYELIPALYDCLYLHNVLGRATIRPLVYNFPEDPNVLNENTELMLGDSLLLAPMLSAGEEVRSVYFPDDFYSYASGRLYKKGYQLVSLADEPNCFFVRSHSLLAMNPRGTKTTEWSDTLRLLWTGETAATYHYEDDGDGLAFTEGRYNLYLIKADMNEGLSFSTIHKGMKSHYKTLQLDLINGKSITQEFPKEN